MDIPYCYSLLDSSRGLFYFSIFSRAYSTAWITKFEKETSLPVIASLTLSITSMGKRIVLFSLSLRLGLISNAILHTSFNTKCIARCMQKYAPIKASIKHCKIYCIFRQNEYNNIIINIILSKAIERL